MAQLELVHPAEARFESKAPPRADHVVIAQMVQDKAWALDVGCGDGALMSLLARECGARVRGLERDRALAHTCVSRGLSVVQGDAETDLADFPSASFDYVIFSRSLQHLRRPFAALKEAGRVGERVIVSIGNAGHWAARMRLLLRGQLGETDVLHRYTVRDFAQQARAMRFGIERAVPLSRNHQGAPFARTLWRANWFAEDAVFLLAP
jgi:methionine biosynthesis protein MetW